mgnify:FL=1
MKKLMHLLFLSCLKATELIEKKLAFKLSFSERIQLAIHKKMCGACAIYEDQSKFIEEGFKELQKSFESKYADMEEFKNDIMEKTNRNS